MEKSNNRVIVVSFLLALVCLGILGGIVYFKINKKTEQKPVETKEEEKANDIVEEPVEENKENENYEEIATNLYSIIGKNPEFRYADKVTFDDLSENVRDSIVLNNLNESCQENVTYDKILFETKYKEIFNQEKALDDGFCKLNNGNYECTRYCGEYSETIFNKFEKFENIDNSIIIYEQAGHLDYSDDGKVYLKENELDSASIASFDTLDELKDSSVQYKLPTYKHTFAKGDSNYYWVSSESVKQ